MSDSNIDNPTKPELAILKLLWRKSDLSARDIHTAIGEEFSWSYSTVRTVLERMNDKGLVSKEAVNGVNIYRALVSKVALLGRMITDFTDRVLELDATPAAAFFSNSKLLTDDEIDELETLLRDTEEKS